MFVVLDFWLKWRGVGNFGSAGHGWVKPALTIMPDIQGDANTLQVQLCAPAPLGVTGWRLVVVGSMNHCGKT
ncbi:hypothetical protein [Pseudomonas alkylphenolica]|uniref:hypothetical protein n=1 Tax=Pseudomonas alkylphenolica TaxID=237609 RepID=UPI00315D6B57